MNFHKLYQMRISFLSQISEISESSLAEFHVLKVYCILSFHYFIFF